MVGNTKVLSEDELSFLINKYSFGVANVDNKQYIVVKSNNYDRMVLHDSTKKFTLNTPIKKLSISPEAINLWLTELNNYSLIEVQNAINALIVTFQDITIEDIKNQLKRKNSKINIQ